MFKNNKYIFGARFGSFIGWICQAAEPQISSVHNLGPKACSIHCGLNLYIAFVQRASFSASQARTSSGNIIIHGYSFYSRAMADLSKLVKMPRSRSDAFYVMQYFPSCRNKQIIPNLQIDIQDLLLHQDLLLPSHTSYGCWASGSLEIELWSNLGKTDSNIGICHHHVSTLLGPPPHAVARAAAVNREHDEWSASPQLVIVNNIFLHQQESYSSMIDDGLFNTLISIGI